MHTSQPASVKVLQGNHAKILSLEEGDESADESTDAIKHMSIIIDSRATEHVLPSKECKDVPLRSTAESRSGYEYETADGGTVVNEGERDMVFATREGRLNQLASQVANINKGLGSVNQLVEDGMEVTLNKRGAHIFHPGGEKTWSRKQ